MNIREKIKKWFFKEELEQFQIALSNMNTAENLFKSAKKIYQESEEKLEDAKRKVIVAKSQAEDYKKLSEDCLILMNSICEVGVDVRLNGRSRDHNESWAVICVHGNIDYVKFVSMEQRDIREIAEFLKRFKYSNMHIDTPAFHAIRDYIKFEF